MSSFAPRLRHVVLASLLLLALAPVALARSHGGGTRTVAPPGNSGVSQYVETVPTAGGGRPTNTVHPGHGSTGGSSGGGGGGGGGSQGTGGGGSIAAGTAKALVHGGPDGAATVALARATAPAALPNQPRIARPGQPTATRVASPAGDGPSPLASLVKAVAGGGGNGLGALLPVILSLTLVGSAAAAIIRHRSTS